MIEGIIDSDKKRKYSTNEFEYYKLALSNKDTKQYIVTSKHFLLINIPCLKTTKYGIISNVSIKDY